MAPDDRDRNLDKALARHFHSSADVLSAAASSPAPALSACPDAEILAAYHDGSLSPEELALWKPHVLCCGDCQLVLEHLATPLDAPAALDKVPVLTNAQTAQTPPSLAATAASPVSSVLPTPVQSAPAPLSIARPRKGYFRWLVPTGAIAAGLLTWVVIRESGLPKLGPRIEPVSLQTAANRQAPLPSPPALLAPAPSAGPAPKRVSPAPNATDQQLSAQLDELRQDSVEPQKQKEKDQQASGVVAGDLSLQTRDNEQQLRSRLQSSPQSASRFAATAPHGPRLTQQQQQIQQNQRVLGGPPVDAKEAQAQADAELAREGEALTAQLPPPAAKRSPDETSNFLGSDSITPQPQPPSKVAKAAAAPRTPSPAPSTTSTASGAQAAVATTAPAAADKSRSSDAVGAATETVIVESTAPSTSMLRVASAAARGPQAFNDPAFKSFWRVGPSGSLEFSSDNGATWTSQSTGVTADLFTGSAPAAKVCWVVGANGVIFRTTDAGKHWLKINSPVAIDILGIHATDAFHATIWLAPDPKSTNFQTYKTSDGGLTWSLIPNN